MDEKQELATPHGLQPPRNEGSVRKVTVKTRVGLL